MTITSEDAGQLHCHEGATSFCTQKVYDWFDEVISSKYVARNTSLSIVIVM
ncbi:hypothetical protein BX600DRAFT_467118, partial [Xylariales sp. PMI_506]